MNEKNYKMIKEKIDNYLGQFGEIYTPDEITNDLDDLIGLEIQKKLLDAFFKSFIDYSQRSTKFSFPIPIIFSSLLVGPPGTGKTTIAKAFAKKYDLPILVIFSNALIGSLLGESLTRIKNLLHQAEKYAKENGPLILFFDEIDAITGERANTHEVGEIKRMVISFLQELDLLLEKHLPIGVLGATNHPNQLDKAVWRRFTFKIDFPSPNQNVRKNLINYFLEKIDKHEFFQVLFIDDEEAIDLIDKATKNMTGADIERVFQIALLQSYTESSEEGDNMIYLTYESVKNAIDSIINIKDNKNYNEDIDDDNDNDSNYNSFNSDDDEVF